MSFYGAPRSPKVPLPIRGDKLPYEKKLGMTMRFYKWDDAVAYAISLGHGTVTKKQEWDVLMEEMRTVFIVEEK